jgi:hypothetical protein
LQLPDAVCIAYITNRQFAVFSFIQNWFLALLNAPRRCFSHFVRLVLDLALLVARFFFLFLSSNVNIKLSLIFKINNHSWQSHNVEFFPQLYGFLENTLALDFFFFTPNPVRPEISRNSEEIM